MATEDQSSYQNLIATVVAELPRRRRVPILEAIRIVAAVRLSDTKELDDADGAESLRPGLEDAWEV